MGGRVRNERIWVVIVQARHEQATLIHDSTWLENKAKYHMHCSVLSGFVLPAPCLRL